MKAEQQAQVLRDVATSIENSARPIDALGVIYRYAGDSLKYRQVVDLYLLGHDGPGFMAHVIKRAGIELGVKIGEKLAATYRGVTRRDDRHFSGRDEAVYDAEVYVLTPSELKRVVEEAIRAGRNGA